jgi:phosphomannomutase / phosphoglucomutase
MIDAKLFKKYDIRGRALGNQPPLTTEAARLIGRAFGHYLSRVEGKSTAVVGRDNRHTSPALAEAAIEGLRAASIHVIDIGLTSTPLVYWHALHTNNAGGMMVTGSHLAPDQNGFKLSVGARNLYGDDLQALRMSIESDSRPGALDATPILGRLTTVDDPLASYFDEIVPKILMARPLKVVVDAGNGTGGLIAPELLRRWGHEVVCLFCEPDGSYPNHQPDPAEPENMHALGDKVREVGADIGLAFDGDSDRVGVVDERGEMIVADRVLALLARDLLARHPGAAVVGDVLSSQVLFDVVANAGGKPVMWASGHSLVKAKMAEIGALLGGEQSGHIFMGEDFYGYDDAFFVAGRLLALLASSAQPLSALDAALPHLFSTPEYRPRCPDELKSVVIEGVGRLLEGKGEIVSVDGVRVKFPRGWGLLRASNTEPVLSLRFEGETEADAIAYRDLFFEALKAYPQVELKR